MTQAPPPPASPYGPGNEIPDASTILVLGIVGIVVSVVVCGPVGAILGWIAVAKGSAAKKLIAAAPPGTYSNEGNVTAGYICGWVAIVLGLLGLIVACGFALLLIPAMAMGGGVGP